MCCRATPNIRATYLAHHRVAAYLMVKPVSPMGMRNVKQDLCIKLLATGQRQYQAGLMLHQRPYQILKPDQVGIDKLWVANICKNYDSVTGGTTMEEGSSGSLSEEQESDGDDDDDGSFQMGSGSGSDHGGTDDDDGSEKKKKKAAGKKAGKGGKSKRGKGKGTGSTPKAKAKGAAKKAAAKRSA